MQKWFVFVIKSHVSIVQVALYTRRELNIRSTANFLLAFCARHVTCRIYLQKYFTATVCLPSDWIEVVELYQVHTELLRGVA